MEGVLPSVAPQPVYSIQPADTNQPCYFQRLATELIFGIFSFLDPSSLERSSAVCHSWQILANEELLWKVYHHHVEGPIKPESLTWKESFINRHNLRKGFYRQLEHHLGPGTITNLSYSDKKGLILEKSRPLEQKNALEVWEQQKNAQPCTVRVYEIHKLASTQAIVTDNLCMYNGARTLKEGCWELKTYSILDGDEKALHRYVHFSEKPVQTFFDHYENKVITKIDHSMLIIADLIQKRTHYFPLHLNNGYPGLIRRHGDGLWITDGNKLKILNLVSCEYMHEIDLPSLAQFHYSADPHHSAFVDQHLLFVTKQKLICYSLTENSLGLSWEVEITEGLKKRLVIPLTISPYLGLYHPQDKTLQIFDVQKGELLGQHTHVEAKHLIIDDHSIRYQNGENQLVIRSFNPAMEHRSSISSVEVG